MAYPSAPGSSPPGLATSNKPISQSDADGVAHLTIGSILGLVVQALIWVGVLLIYEIVTALTNATNSLGVGSTALPGWITLNTLYAVAGLLAGGLLLGIVSYVFFYLGFRSIKRGASDFGAPTTLVLIGLIGYLMTAIGLLVIIGTVASAISSTIAGTVTAGSASLDISAIFGGIALIGLGAILSLVGVIGLILGNWRTGTRYGQGMLKAGAILTIIPFVSIVGYVLLLVGYLKAGSMIRSGWTPPSAGGVMMGAPNANWQAPPMAPPPAPAGAAPTCPKCGQPGTWVAQYSRWYCHTDQTYL